jgi:hypothetical protein
MFMSILGSVGGQAEIQQREVGPVKVPRSTQVKPELMAWMIYNSP